jgi:hypothetical protein
MLGLLATVWALSSTSSAWACRMVVPNVAELARHENVALVSIQTATRLENPGWNTWRVTARTLESIAGSRRPQNYTFVTTQSSDGCGLTPLPPQGERWIVYFSASARDEILAAYPLALVREYDSRLADVR